MDAYRWRYEILLESMNKIAKTGNKDALEALDKVKIMCKPFDQRKQQTLDLLEAGPMEFNQIEKGIGIAASSIDKIITALRNEKKIYVHSFNLVGSRSTIRKVWAAGNKPDAIYVPKVKSPRVKIKKQVAHVAPVVAKVKVFRDPMVSALFGPR